MIDIATRYSHFPCRDEKDLNNLLEQVKHDCAHEMSIYKGIAELWGRAGAQGITERMVLEGLKKVILAELLNQKPRKWSAPHLRRYLHAIFYKLKSAGHRPPKKVPLNFQVDFPLKKPNPLSVLHLYFGLRHAIEEANTVNEEQFAYPGIQTVSRKASTALNGIIKLGNSLSTNEALIEIEKQLLGDTAECLPANYRHRFAVEMILFYIRVLETGALNVRYGRHSVHSQRGANDSLKHGHPDVLFRYILENMFEPARFIEKDPRRIAEAVFAEIRCLPLELDESLRLLNSSRTFGAQSSKKSNHHSYKPPKRVIR